MKAYIETHKLCIIRIGWNVGNSMRCQPIGFVNKHPFYASGKDDRS